MSTVDPAIALPSEDAAVISVSPLTVRSPGRLTKLCVRVSAPVFGDRLPILLLSHGHGPSNYVSSLYGYAPLANYFAARGFVVIQPTHLDSKTLPYRSSDHPDAPLFWRSRAEDMSRILDELEPLQRAVPAIAGRLDPGKVGVLGHSMGGHTASVLLGASHKVPAGGPPTRMAEPRVKAGVLLAAPGRGDALSAYAAEHYPFLATIDFSTMTTPALVIAGDADVGAHLTTAGPSWYADPYQLSPGGRALVTLFGAGHLLGGVSGYDVAETTDEHPERVATVQRLAWAFLRSQLYPADTAWQDAQNALAAAAAPLGRVTSK
jgi:predicted dienelactone hydrolase